MTIIGNLSGEELSKIDSSKLRQYNNVVKKEIAYKLATFYKQNPFPYYQLTDQEKKDAVLKLYRMNPRILCIDDYQLNQAMQGLVLANSYHKQMWEVRCNKSKYTPKEIFDNVELLTKAILTGINITEGPIKIANIRQLIRMWHGTQAVSNFKPTVAKYFYNKYCIKGGNVLDPCAGFGGRLLGALTSNIDLSSYTGIDPAIITQDNNLAMKEEVSKILLSYNKNVLLPKGVPKINLVTLPFEEFTSGEKYDLIFTSPPYFNIERYSKEATQSYVRYTTYRKWLRKFLFVLIEHSYYFLNPGGYFIINVSDKIANDMTGFANKLFTYSHTYQMRLSLLCGNGRNRSETPFKTEPILVYKKEK